MDRTRLADIGYVGSALSDLSSTQESRTKVCEWYDIHNAKVLRRLLAFMFYVKLLSHSAVAAIATDYIFRAEDLALGMV